MVNRLIYLSYGTRAIVFMGVPGAGEKQERLSQPTSSLEVAVNLLWMGGWEKT